MNRKKGEMNVEWVICGDGSVDKSGLTLENGKMYGNECKTGGYESYYQIDFQSLNVWNVTLEVPEMETMIYEIGTGVSNESEAKTSLSESISPCAIYSNLDGNIIARRKTGKYLALSPKNGNVGRQLEAWCFENRGVPVFIGGPGARCPIYNIKRYQVDDQGHILMSQKSGFCAIASMVNAIDCLVGRLRAEEAMSHWRNTTPKVRSLKDLNDLIQDLKFNLCVRKVSKDEKEALELDRFKWLAERKKGVWIVRVEKKKIVDHCFVIDGYRGLVVDSYSSLPLKLSKAVLKRMGGSKVRELEVTDIRQLCHERRKKRKVSETEVISLV